MNDLLWLAGCVIGIVSVVIAFAYTLRWLMGRHSQDTTVRPAMSTLPYFPPTDPADAPELHMEHQ